MKIQQIRKGKEEYMEMLLMAEPQRDVIESYLDRGEMFVLVNGGDVCAVCVVELLKNRKCELRNIATRVEERGKGYAKSLIRHVCEHYGNQCDTMYAGTGNSRKTLEFLGKCGFVNSHIAANYYAEHYREPVYEGDVKLTDKIYLKKQLDSEVNVKKVVDLALEAGRILLKNGAEIFRVDETMIRICQRFHVEYVDTFILSHAIFISAENGMEETYTKVKQVPLSSSHLGIVAEVNELSREISEGLVSIEEAVRRLKEIDGIPEKKEYFQVLAMCHMLLRVSPWGVGNGKYCGVFYRMYPVCMGACREEAEFVEDDCEYRGRRDYHGSGNRGVPPSGAGKRAVWRDDYRFHHAAGAWACIRQCNPGYCRQRFPVRDCADD